MIATQRKEEKVATALANARGGRRGMPPIENVLEMLPPKLLEEVMDDAKQVLKVLYPPHP